MTFFNFIEDMPHYQEAEGATIRLNTRHRFLIAPFAEQIKDARILDLGAHDGRWSYAFAASGAREVLAVEGRAETAEHFANYPDAELKARVTWQIEDVYAALDTLIAEDAHFDIIAVFGLLYHLPDPLGFFERLFQLSAPLMIIDSEVIQRKDPIVRIVEEDPKDPLNGLAQTGRQNLLKTVPSKGAIELMTKDSGYDLKWTNWDLLRPVDRAFVRDYFRKTHMRRETIIMSRQS